MLRILQKINNAITWRAELLWQRNLWLYLSFIFNFGFGLVNIFAWDTLFFGLIQLLVAFITFWIIPLLWKWEDGLPKKWYEGFEMTCIGIQHVMKTQPGVIPQPYFEFNVSLDRKSVTIAEISESQISFRQFTRKDLEYVRGPIRDIILKHTK